MSCEPPNKFIEISICFIVVNFLDHGWDNYTDEDAATTKEPRSRMSESEWQLQRDRATGTDRTESLCKLSMCFLIAIFKYKWHFQKKKKIPKKVILLKFTALILFIFFCVSSKHFFELRSIIIIKFLYMELKYLCPKKTCNLIRFWMRCRLLQHGGFTPSTNLIILL